jgi:hypothetical protein
MVRAVKWLESSHTCSNPAEFLKFGSAKFPPVNRKFGWKILHTCKVYLEKYFCLENIFVWKIPVFCYGLLMRNRGYIEFETL